MRWISINEKVPKDDETVIIYHDVTRRTSIGWYDEEDCVFFNYDGILPVVVTHWCEILEKDF